MHGSIENMCRHAFWTTFLCGVKHFIAYHACTDVLKTCAGTRSEHCSCFGVKHVIAFPCMLGCIGKASAGRRVRDVWLKPTNSAAPRDLSRSWPRRPAEGNELVF